MQSASSPSPRAAECGKAPSLRGGHAESRAARRSETPVNSTRAQILHLLSATSVPMSARSICARLPNVCEVTVRLALGDLLHSEDIEMRSDGSSRGAQLLYWLRAPDMERPRP